MQWLMLQPDQPDDFVIATGKQHSVKDFINLAAKNLGIAIQWEGEGIHEKGINMANGKTVVAVDSTYFRPTEVETLLGDPTKAKEKLGVPKITFEEVVKEMVQVDLEEAKRDELVQRAGFRVSSHSE
jgi:GDPmannose 4,6-dehydratase